MVFVVGSDIERYLATTGNLAQRTTLASSDADSRTLLRREHVVAMGDVLMIARRYRHFLDGAVGCP